MNQYTTTDLLRLSLQLAVITSVYALLLCQAAIAQSPSVIQPNHENIYSDYMCHTTRSGDEKARYFVSVGGWFYSPHFSQGECRITIQVPGFTPISCTGTLGELQFSGGDDGGILVLRACACEVRDPQGRLWQLSYSDEKTYSGMPVRPAVLDLTPLGMASAAADLRPIHLKDYCTEG